MTNLKKIILKSIPFDNQGRIDSKAFHEKFGIFEAFHILIFFQEGYSDEAAKAVIGARLMDEGMKYQRSDIPFTQWPEAIQELYPGLGGRPKHPNSNEGDKTKGNEARNPGRASVRNITTEITNDISKKADECHLDRTGISDTFGKRDS